MDILQLISIGIIGAVLTLTVKEYKPELAFGVSLLTGVIIFAGCIGAFGEIIRTINDMVKASGVKTEYFMSVIKIIGIAYVTQFAAEMCRDSGQSAIASKLEFGGKVFILLLILPIIIDFIKVCQEVIQLV